MAMKVTIRPGGSGYCPKCREAISREATTCPHCRSDLSEDPEWQAEQAKAGCAPLILLGVSTVMLGVALAHWAGRMILS